MKKSKKILVLGYFGYENNQLDGQTVKTRNLRQLLEEQYGKEHIDFYDTQEFKNRRFSIFKMFTKVCRCNTLVYLPAHNNLKYVFPIIFLLSRLCRFKIHYFVVGGWLNEFIVKLPLHRAMLRKIKGIHAETKRLKNDLEKNYGYKNVDIFPNFRFFDFSPKRNPSPKLRLVFMARIMKQKGLDWIFNLAEYISNNNLTNKINITFWGQINQEDRDYFMSNVEKYSFVEYNGHLQPEKIYPVISQFDVMLFPTHFYTEGLPGTVVDAYISGIPVIATEWKHAHEFIDDGVNGYIIPFENGTGALIDKIIYLSEHSEELRALQDNALKHKELFTPPHLRL